MHNNERIEDYKARRLVIKVPEDEELKGLVASILSTEGREYPDPNPIIIPVETKQLTIEERMMKVFQHHLIRREATARGFETIEEASDFDMDDDINDAMESVFQTMVDEEPMITNQQDIKNDVVPGEIPDADNDDEAVTDTPGPE